MLLVFWVLWRLRWLNARETFAAVRWPIPGAVPSSAAVMAFYLRSFEADKLNTKTQRLRGAGFCTMRGTSLAPPRDLRYRLQSVTPNGPLETPYPVLWHPSLHCSSAKTSTPCIIRAAEGVFEDL